MRQTFVAKTGADKFARIGKYWDEDRKRLADCSRPCLELPFTAGNDRRGQFVTDHLQR